MTNYRIPKPCIKTAETDWGMAYCWYCESDKYDLGINGDTKEECIQKFKDAMLLEHGISYQKD